MTTKLPNKLSPLHEPGPHNTALATDRNITCKLNDLIQAHNELVAYVEFAHNFIEQLEMNTATMDSRYGKASTASEQRDNKDIKGGK